MLLNINNLELKESTEIGFKLKSDIQEIVEKNLKLLLDLTYIKSDFVLGQLRFDSLAFDEKNNSFVVLSFVRGNDFSIVDRAFSYLSIIFKNQAEFVLDYIYATHEKIAKNAINWDKCRVIFISQNFNLLQVESLNFRALPIDLYTIRRYEGDIIQFDKVSNNNEMLDSIHEESNANILEDISELNDFSDETYLDTRSSYILKDDKTQEGSSTMQDIELDLGNTKGEEAVSLIKNFAKEDDSLKLDWPFSNQFLRIVEKI